MAVDWQTRGGRALVLLIGLAIQVVLVLIITIAIAAFFNQSYTQVLIHVMIGSLAPYFAYFDGLLTLSYTAIIVAYQIEDSGVNKKDLGAYATGFAISSLMIVLARYFYRAQLEPVMYRGRYK
jgi:hypothetical protein